MTTIKRGDGNMVEPPPGQQIPPKIKAQSTVANNLDWSSHILIAKMVHGEGSQACAEVYRHPPTPFVKRDARA
ncbi:MAG: hypothetical protein OEW33_15145 [Nitrospirota bacterium]|nr:hypothetical protein [Nitrospirota bacterium]MDH5295827.1 hypothetical protein [Nitrospirota bacterium]